MRMLELPEHVKRLLFLGTIILGVILVIVLGMNALIDAQQPSKQHAASSSTTPMPTKKVSPLLFGTNLDFSKNDQLQISQSSSTQQLLHTLHVQIVRISLTERPSQQEITQQAQYIQKIGAIPLVSLHSTLSSQALADDTLAIQTISNVFPGQTVYYEYGDEDDVLGVTADQYTQSWNQIVPKLKQLAPQAQFVGPATYQYDDDYLQQFLQHAQPLPDEISWHEFTCDASWSQQQCLAGIHTWDQHITAARLLMKQFIPSSRPVMITAWNYAANATPTDGKSTDKNFVATWTQNALQTLATNEVFASMQYSGINAPVPLISPTNTLTTQGQTFRNLFEKFITQPLPAPPDQSTPSSTPTLTASSTASTTTNTPVVPPTGTQDGTIGSSPTGASVPIPTPTSPSDSATVPTPTTAASTGSVPTTAAPTPTAASKPAPTPTPTPASASHAVDGKNPTSYTVSGKTCAATLSNSTPKSVSFNGVTGTLYFQFSITCHAAWAKIVFSKAVAANALGNAKIVRNGDGKAYTCDSGGNLAVAPGQTSCYTGMVYDGPDATASAYGWYKSASGSSSWSSQLGPF
ncbi:hypothetical protein KSF_036290 [Reticulibacter mediterranei]|uniref:Uncharacterized protein n=1 Tax=Reticulibacter mediterranei TaxID=2778369 RepID=A0A8J3IFJ7_9CHLR|nr:DUF2690 domain-containing protein [Reticulibacter mediterranei]GHO93581.1 hypothetical protein KSF_036290 [Reticulibacter mediterranei]